MQPPRASWRWRRSFLFGIMYGPLPVGWIAAAVLLGGFYVYAMLTP